MRLIIHRFRYFSSVRLNSTQIAEFFGLKQFCTSLYLNVLNHLRHNKKKYEAKKKSFDLLKFKDPIWESYGELFQSRKW